MSRRPAARTTAALAAVVLALALASCSGDDGDGEKKGEPSDSPSSSSPGGDDDTTSSPSSPTTPTEPPTGPPASFDAESVTTFPEVDVREVAISDTTALVMTPQKVVGRTLPGLDLAFEVPASAGNLTDIEVAEDGASLYAVEVGTQPGTGTELGTVVVTLRQVDLDSGEAEDLATTQVPQDQFTGAAASTATIAGVEGDVAVIDLWSGASGGVNPFEKALARHRTLALSTSKGDLAWTVDPGRPVAVRPGLVVVNTGLARAAGALRGVALADGAERWQALPNTAQATLVGADDDAVVVATAGEGRGRGRAHRVDVATGETSAPSGRKVPWNLTCWPTSKPSQVVCTPGSYTVFGWDLGRNDLVWRLPRSGHVGAVATDVYDDVVYGQLADGRAVTVDALTGEDIGDSTTGSAQVVGLWGGVSIVDGQAVFVPAVE